LKFCEIFDDHHFLNLLLEQQKEGRLLCSTVCSKLDKANQKKQWKNNIMGYLPALPSETNQ
jgi:hypothetical protein